MVGYQDPHVMVKAGRCSHDFCVEASRSLGCGDVLGEANI